MDYGRTVPWIRRLVCCLAVALLAVAASAQAPAGGRQIPSSAGWLRHRVACKAGVAEKAVAKIHHLGVRIDADDCVCAETPEEAARAAEVRISRLEHPRAFEVEDPDDFLMDWDEEDDTILADERWITIDPPRGKTEKKTIYCYSMETLRQLAVLPETR